MRRFRILPAALLTVGLTVLATSPAGAEPPTSQIVDGEAFLAGNFAETGINSTGTFGTVNAAPAGFHPSFTDNRLGFVADRDRDGWGVGSDDGDFFLPGSPYEAWYVRVGTTWASNEATYKTDIAGSLGGLVSSGPTREVTWTADNPWNDLNVSQTYVLDVDEASVSIEVSLTNAGAAPLTDVAYIRRVDPDNNQSKGQGFATNNTIASTIADDGVAMVTAGQDDGSLLAMFSTHPGAAAHIGGTSFDLDSIIEGTGSTLLTERGATNEMDAQVGVSIVVGDLDPGETATFSFAYALDEASAPTPAPPTTTTPPTTTPPTTIPVRTPIASIGGGSGGLNPEQLAELNSTLPDGIERIATTLTPSGEGTWTVAADGGVFTTGDAYFHGSLGDINLQAPAVGISTAPDLDGYWIVAADGGVFTFGDAPFHGSLGDITLNKPIDGMAPTCDSQSGYYLYAADGGVFTFGDAYFHGSLGDIDLSAPIVAMVATCTNQGYWLIGADGGVFTFGDAPFHGSLATETLDQPIIGMIPTIDGNGYWLVDAANNTYPFGNAAD